MTPRAGSVGLWSTLPPTGSLGPIATARSGNVWIPCAKSGCSRNYGPRARLPGKRGSKEMRVLVTGHRGYIGSLLVGRLMAAGHEAVGVDIQLYEDCTFGGNKDSGIPTINR